MDEREDFEGMRVCSRGLNGKLQRFKVGTEDHGSAIASVKRALKDNGAWHDTPVLAVIEGGRDSRPDCT